MSRPSSTCGFAALTEWSDRTDGQTRTVRFRVSSVAADGVRHLRGET